MQNTSLITLYAGGFSLGFFWVCYQIGIEFSKILKSLVGGFALGFAGLWLYKNLSHQVSFNHLFLPMLGILGATCLLWFQSREQLAQKISRDSVYLLTLTFIYFFSPWKGEFRFIGLLSAAPCALILFYCVRLKEVDSVARVGLMFWTMLVSLVIGVQQLWSSLDSLVPAPNATGGGSALLSAALQAAGLVTLAFSLVPFVDWVRGLLRGVSVEADHQMMSDAFSFKRALILAVVHAAPLVLNWKYQYFSYETMVGYALVWSPIISSSVADMFEPEKADTCPWEHDATQAS